MEVNDARKDKSVVKKETHTMGDDTAEEETWGSCLLATLC